MHGVARKGWSAVAAQPIAQGKFLCQYAGELISTAEAKRRLAVYDNLKAPCTGHALLVSSTLNASLISSWRRLPLIWIQTFLKKRVMT
jgi:hypothetical protein